MAYKKLLIRSLCLKIDNEQISNWANVDIILFFNLSCHTIYCISTKCFTIVRDLIVKERVQIRHRSFLWGNNARPLKKTLTKTGNYSLLKKLYYDSYYARIQLPSLTTKNYGYFGIYGGNSTTMILYNASNACAAVKWIIT